MSITVEIFFDEFIASFVVRSPRSVAADVMMEFLVSSRLVHVLVLVHVHVLVLILFSRRAVEEESLPLGGDKLGREALVLMRVNLATDCRKHKLTNEAAAT